MQYALTLAMRMRGHVWPNPPVGCVIVKNGLVIAQGATRPGGRPHAERVAIEQAGADAMGGTLYVTLEPCCHWGKTPPCAEAIVEAGISRVVCPIQDPDPRVNGGGFGVLHDAGVDLTVGLFAEAAQEVTSGFFWRLRRGEPEVAVVSEVMEAVPPGIDGLITTSRGRLRVHTDLGDITEDIQGRHMPRRRLLTRIAALGLTSVAVHRDDPILHELSASRRLEAERPTAGRFSGAATAGNAISLWKDR